MAAGVNHAADLKLGDGAANLGDFANNFMDGYAGIERVVKVVGDLVNLGVTDPAIQDVD